MSSTLQANRTGHDDYPTPGWATRAFLPYLANYIQTGPTTILEPAAGAGAIVRELNAWRSNLLISTVEIRDVQPLEGLVTQRRLTGDFLQLRPHDFDPFDVVITNPPYSHALEFVNHSLRHIWDGGIVVMLLRLAFLESQDRSAWLQRNAPDIYVLSRRPSFDVPHPPKCSNGSAHDWKKLEKTDEEKRITCARCGVKKAGTDSAAYAWMVWRKQERTSGTVRVLECEARK